VQVGVVDERARARRREPHDERAIRFDQWRQPLTIAAPPVHAVVVAVELDAVPVQGSRFSQAIDHGDLDRVSAPQDDRRAGCGGDTRCRNRRNAVAAQRESEGRLGRRQIARHDERQLSCCLIVFPNGSRTRRRHHRHAQDHSGHAASVVAAVMRTVVSTVFVPGGRGRGKTPLGRGVVHYVAVKQPVAHPFRQPRQRHRLA